MKNIFFLFLAVLSFNSYSQDDKFGIRSIEQKQGISTSFSKYHEFGINMGLGITSAYNRNLFALNLNAGVNGKIELYSSGVNQFYNFNFMYGREYAVNKWLVLEGFVGVGYMILNRENEDTDWIYETNQVFNLPISLNVLFVNAKVFRMGINPMININSFKILYSTNLVFQFKFR